MSPSSSTLPVPVTSRARSLWLVATLLVALLTLQVQGAPDARAADPVTYAGPTYPAAGPSPTEDKPQSKLWYNDGSWWALMRATGGVFIHRLGTDHVWRNTNTRVDERIASTGDALWDGSKLYVGSRVSGGAMRAIRFSYNASNDTYTVDAGFPKQVASGGTESMSIAKDSTGRLWVAYTQGSPRRVYVAHSTTSETTWSAPFLVPVPDNTVNSDDIAGIISFAGRVGVMWSDQDDDVMRFAVHPDSAAPTAGWSVESALSGPNLADDHLNLKSLSGDSSGRLFAAVKTSRGDAGEPTTDPSIVVLQRSSAGTWTNAVASRVGDKLTRPQIALDSTNSRLYVLMSTESGGTVYYKSTPLGSLAFGTGRGAPFITAAGASINDASTTKQTVNASTGLVVLASDDDALRYYHGELSLGAAAPVDGTPPSAPTNVTGSSPSPTSVTLSWTASTDNVGVAGYRVFRNGTQVGTPSGTSYTDTGLTAGTTYSYTVAAVDAAGNVSAQSSPARTVTTQSGTTTDTTPPSVPAGVTGSSPSSTSVALSWTASTDNVGVAGYRVFRNGTQVGTPTGTTYTDSGLTAATQYSYTVAAVDAAGNASAQSTPPTVVTTQQGGTTPPPAGATFVGAATATGTTNSTSVGAPAGATTGDVLVAVVSSRGAPTVATPAGWTLVRRDANGTTMQQTVFVRPATTSNASTWTLSSAQSNVVQVLAYRGVDTANPVVAAGGGVSTTTAITSPAVASVAGGPVLTLAGQARTATLAPATPLAERSEITTVSTATYKVTANAADTTAGGTSSGPYTTTANGSAGGIGQTLALRPRA